MCGLVALIQKKNIGFIQKDIAVFSQLLYADALRGMDGTGVIFNAKRGKAHIKTLKCAVPSATFLSLPEYETVVKTLFNESNFAVGHNRSATKGKIDNDCTHPFRVGHITLVHNGTLFNHKTIKDVAVDSEAICHSLAEEGYHKTLKKLDGAFALIWFDTKERSLYFCRNNQRPLFIIETAFFTILVSELELGLWILKRNSVHVISSKIVPSETVHKMTLPIMDEIKTEKVDYYSAAKYGRNNMGWYGHGSWEDDWRDSNEGGAAKKQEGLGLPKPNEEKPASQSSPGSYAFGETVKFYGKHVNSTLKNSYLVGDFYHKGTNILEEKNRIKVFGKESDLLQLTHRVLIGKIGVFDTYNNITTYVITDPKPVIGIGQKDSAKITDLIKCDWCEGLYDQAKATTYNVGDTDLDNYVICPSCAAQVNSPEAGKIIHS